MKILLNDIQKNKLAEALRKENSMVEQARIAESLAKGAIAARRDIFDMICDAHGIDQKKFDEKMNFDTKTGTLTLSEIRTPHNAKSIKDALKIASHGKAKRKSKKN